MECSFIEGQPVGGIVFRSGELDTRIHWPEENAGTIRWPPCAKLLLLDPERGILNGERAVREVEHGNAPAYALLRPEDDPAPSNGLHSAHPVGAILERRHRMRGG